MKNTPFLFSAVAAAMLHAPHCAAQSNVVFYGTNSSSIGVAFVDTNLSITAKSAIVADLQVCLNAWGKNSEVRLRIKETSAGYFYNSTECPLYPEGIDFPENILISLGSPALQIPRKLSDAYTNAFAFVAANSNTVAAAYEFVALVSSSNFVSSVTSNTIHNYFLVKGMTNQYYQTEFSGIIEGFFQYPKYYLPSILGFYHSANGPGTNNLYMTLPTKTNPGYGYDDWVGLPAIWHDNKWKICVGYEWVP